MRYKITGKHIDIGEALQTHCETELREIIGKYSNRPVDAQVIFSKNAHQFACEVIVHLSTGLTTQAKGLANDIYASFDSAGEKMEKQLRRYKRRLKNHHNERAEPVELSHASSYILASESGVGDQEPESLQPIIIAETETKIPSLSVGEAVMQMELSSSQVLVFKNERNRGVNVVYRRDDGNIGWIDPSQSN